MALEHDLDTPLALAVRRAGSQSAFGRIIGKRQSVVRYWLEKGVYLPGDYVLAAERATGVSRYELNPTVYGPAPGPTAAMPSFEPVR